MFFSIFEDKKVVLTSMKHLPNTATPELITKCYIFDVSLCYSCLQTQFLQHRNGSLLNCYKCINS